MSATLDESETLPPAGKPLVPNGEIPWYGEKSMPANSPL
jgi:hypothetical protein